MIDFNELPTVEGATYALANVEELAQYTLSQEEEEDLFIKGSSSEKRIRDFTLGRLAAKKALQKIGILNPQPVRRGKRGEPLWPPRVVGSISHTGDIGVAVCADSALYRGIGIDIEEKTRELSFDIASYIATTEEQGWLQGQTDSENALLLFCAKESIYKALAPLVERFIGFKEVELKFGKSLECKVRFLNTELMQFNNSLKVYAVIKEKIVGAVTTLK